LPPVAHLSVKAARCCGRYAPSTAPTTSAACACRCTAGASCVLPVVPGAIWTRRGRSGARSSSARRPSEGLQPTGNACHAGDRYLRLPGRQRQPQGSAPHIFPHRVRLLQGSPTWPSTWRRSRPPCRVVAARRTCSNAAFPWPWRSSWAWAMRRRASGRIQPATGAGAAWFFRTPPRMAMW
jgi:hypothetical protein